MLLIVGPDENEADQQLKEQTWGRRSLLVVVLRSGANECQTETPTVPSSK